MESCCSRLGLTDVRINIDLNAKVNISSGSQISIYAFY